jgi:hypothetical protein
LLCIPAILLVEVGVEFVGALQRQFHFCRLAR